MKRLKTVLTASLMAGFMLSSTSYAMEDNNKVLAAKCSLIAHELWDISKTQPENPCSQHVISAGAHVIEAGRDIKINDRKHGELRLRVAEAELRRIKQSSGYCAYFAPLVMNSIDALVYLQLELKSGHSF